LPVPPGPVASCASTCCSAIAQLVSCFSSGQGQNGTDSELDAGAVLLRRADRLKPPPVRL